MKFIRTSKTLFVACSVFCLVTTNSVSKNLEMNQDKQKSNKEVVKTPSLKTNKAIVKYAVDDIKASLNKPEGKLSMVCCTYKLNGAKVVSKEIKTRFNGYRVKPAYHKECFLNESTYQPDRIVQVKFNKHSDKLLVTYKDPNDKGHRIYSEKLDATKYNFTEQS